MRKVYGDEIILAIHEVHYDANDKVTGWSDGPAVVMANQDLDETITEQLELLSTAVDKPTLNYDTGEEIK